MFWNRDEIPDYVSLDDDLFKTDDGTIINNENNKVKYNIPKKESPKKEKKKININLDKAKIINIVIDLILVIVLIIAFMILFDVIRVTRYEKLPIFASHTYKSNKYDAYNGIGYKVYYYHIKDGKNYIEIGGNDLKYNDKPIETTTYDLSLLFENDFNKFTKEYLNKYISIKGEVYKEDNDYIYLKYDKEKKYKTEYRCKLLNYKKVKKGSVTVKGMLIDYDKENKIIYVDNCSVK